MDKGGYLPVSVGELLVCFMAIFYRQCFSKTFIYLYHNQLDSSSDFNDCVIQSLKYGALSPTGAGARMKPFIKIAIANGCLSKKDCKDSPIALKALELYPHVHSIWQQGGKDAAEKFAYSYGMEMLVSPTEEVLTEEAMLGGDLRDDEGEDEQDEQEDQENDHSGFLLEGEGSMEHDKGQSDVDDDDEEEDEVELCKCEFCLEMRSYDNVDMSQVESDDPLDRVMISALALALENAKTDEDDEKLK